MLTNYEVEIAFMKRVRVSLQLQKNFNKKCKNQELRTKLQTYQN